MGNICLGDYKCHRCKIFVNVRFETHCCDCQMNCLLDEIHCCKKRQNFIYCIQCEVKYPTNKNHCCDCNMNYNPSNETHCCKCKMNQNTYDNHCCKCKINYGQYDMHCCDCELIYKASQTHCCKCKKIFDLFSSTYDHKIPARILHIHRHCCKCNTIITVRDEYDITDGILGYVCNKHCCICKGDYSENEKHCNKCHKNYGYNYVYNSKINENIRESQGLFSSLMKSLNDDTEHCCSV
jgi:hypothetical protein